MYKNKVQKVILISSILFLIGGCAGKTDFTQGVSEEDKKLLSSYDDEVIYIYIKAHYELLKMVFSLIVKLVNLFIKEILRINKDIVIQINICQR